MLEKFSFSLSVEDADKLLKNWRNTFKVGDRELDLTVDDDSYLYYADGDKLCVDVIVKDYNTNTYYKIRGGVECTRRNNDYVWCQFPSLDSNKRVSFDFVAKVFDGVHWVEMESFE